MAVSKKQKSDGPSLVVVELETPSFSFRAVGRTESEARANLERGWAKHCKQTGADEDLLDFAIDGTARTYTAGDCWRDDFRLVSGTEG